MYNSNITSVEAAADHAAHLESFPMALSWHTAFEHVLAQFLRLRLGLGLGLLLSQHHLADGVISKTGENHERPFWRKIHSIRIDLEL